VSPTKAKINRKSVTGAVEHRGRLIMEVEGGVIPIFGRENHGDSTCTHNFRSDDYASV
jgi:hypothetical protein